MSETSTEEPEERSSRAVWPVLAVVAIALIGVVVAAQILGSDDDEPAPTTTAPTTETTAPTNTSPPPPTTEPPTTEPPEATEPTPTTEPEVSGPDEYPDRALVVAGADLAWLDTNTGVTETIHEFFYEASFPGGMALSGDGTTAHYQLYYEDSWFSCETASGQVMMLDVATGAETEIARGLPAMSPDGSRLAYLTSDDCFPDPDEPQFFLAVFDTLVVATPDGSEQARFELAADTQVPGDDSLVNLVWLDPETILVLDQGGTTYAVDAGGSGTVDSFPTIDLPDHHLLAVVDDWALGVTVEATQIGPLTRIDLVTGEAVPVPGLPDNFFYEVGVSEEGAIILAVAGSVHVRLDPVTGEATAVFDLPNVGALDW